MTYPSHTTHEGMVLLEKAVLQVLREAGRPLRPAEIAEAAGLFSNPVRGQTTNRLTIGILEGLEHKGLVRPVYNGIRRWQICTTDPRSR